MWLKRLTVQNIVIGGAAGALAAGDRLGRGDGQRRSTPLPWLLFLIIFLWTPPHFWALALAGSDDYARAKVPMLPVVKGARVNAQSHPLLHAAPRARRADRALCARLSSVRSMAAVAAAGGVGFVALAVMLWRASPARRAHRGAASVRLFDLLSVCGLHRARRRAA